MSDFQTQTALPTTAPDPHKHVKYSLGMVLGADDFDQEFAYLSNRDQWLARDAIGYGTLCGLQVKIETGERGPRVTVEPGVALNPRGQLIRVSPPQCAYLNDWLTAQQAEVLQHTGSPPTSHLTLYVTLCSRDCPTDPVPIPGEPCRDETEATVNSRLQDDFELKLSFTPPDQTEENAVRDFVEWLSEVEISDGATSLSLDDFLATIREVAQLGLPPDSPPDFMYGSPLDSIMINHADACEYLRAAFRVWVTELRPLWHGAACAGDSPAENCVLLAELDVALVDNLADSVDLHEEHRPYLVHVRMLQEWITCGPKSTGESSLSPATDVVAETSFGLAANVGTSNNQYALANHTHGTPALPAIPQPSNSVTSELNFDQAATAGDSAEFSRANHTHGTPPLQGDVTFDPPTQETTVQKIQHVAVNPVAPTNGQVLTFNGTQWGPAALPAAPAPALAGDVTGPAGNNTVARIQHVAVNSVAPTVDGHVLTFDSANNRWTARAPASLPATGDFVRYPAGLPRYFIVAAGIVRADGSDALPPNYNNLSAQQISAGRMLVTFGDYQLPNAEHQYLIKAMPVFEEEVWKESEVTQPIVNFEKFVDNPQEGSGIVLYVTDLGEPIENLKTLAFAIEVSEYESK